VSEPEQSVQELRPRVAGSVERGESFSGTLAGHLGPRAVAVSYARRDHLMRRLLLLADTAGVAVALAVMFNVSKSGRPFGYALLGAATIPVWLALFKTYGLYDRDIKRISHSTVDDIPWLLHALLVGSLLLWVFYKVLPVEQLHVFDILWFAGVSAATIILLRALTRRQTVRLLGRERVLFIGDGEPTELLARKMRAHPEYGLEPIGVVPGASSIGDGELSSLGDLSGEDLSDFLARSKADRVVICNTSLGEEALFDLVHRCKERSLKVSVLPQLFGAMGPSVEVDDVEGVTVLGINPPVLPRSSRFIKRSLDIFGSASMLILLAPVIGLVALAIKLGSRGPVFFKQSRIGRGGRPFALFKFRTMVVGAEQRRRELLEQSTDPGWLKLDHDPRITTVGRFLRLTSLDELPELWNVLKGDMSLVGPRPLIASEDSQIGGWARSRLDLTPGITGLWQVLGRTNIPFEEMIKLDYLYVTNWSLWTDVRLILKTLPVVLTRRGAN
jgi:exopolysaccharide biosynthesis polyprenyl glycosylphosphotransferase